MQCHCYACEVPAPCFLWFYHCHATDEDEHSMILWSSVEQNSMAPPYLPESELISTGASSAFSRLVVTDQIRLRGSSITRINRVCKKRSSTKTNRQRRLNSRSQVKRMPTDSEADGLATQIITYSRRYKRRASTPMAVINMKQTRNALSTDRRHSIIDWKQWRDLVADWTCETDKDDKDESYQQLLKRFRLMDMSPRHSNSDTDEDYLRLIRRFRLVELSARRSTSEKTVDIDGKHSKSIH